MICDPSHIGGNRKYIFEIAQKALDLAYDGLMIEVHPNPEGALSDSKQQITPAQLHELLSQLQFRNTYSSNDAFVHILEELRCTLDHYDEKIIEILGQRMAVVREIGRYKKENNITIFQKNRWDEILQNAQQKAKEKGLNINFIHFIFNAIHLESINNQNEIMNQPSNKNE
jgi:chorismate mutase